jgi:16S rRNA processing protein RimM
MAVVGRVARPHGIRGQVIVNLETDFPHERFQPGEELFVNRSGRVEAVVIAAVRFQAGRPVIGLSGIESVEAASALAGAELRIPPDRLMQLSDGMFYRHDLVGCAVETSGGRHLGDVSEVEGDVGGSRLVVASDGGELLIPFAAEICTMIDLRRKRIVVEPPEGLLELNQKGARASPPRRQGPGRERPSARRRGVGR